MVLDFLKNLLGGSSTSTPPQATVSNDNQPEEALTKAPDESAAPVQESRPRHERRSRRRNHGDRQDVHGGTAARKSARKEALAAISAEEAQEVLEQLKQFVLFVAQALVDSPDQLSVSITSKDDGYILVITCNKPDAGKLIGRSGKIISAIRTLVNSSAGKAGVKATVDLLD